MKAKNQPAYSVVCFVLVWQDGFCAVNFGGKHQVDACWDRILKAGTLTEFLDNKIIKAQF
ncbi:hypothetical protein FD50_GL002148 [Liquorilactobacillus satsumensis DSM 16230 = JCM 12392]|uniref:Uncharacterized protein n=1 Tax=Liquorilactobacillus satsumensis DSM 16230 = JCM 12392 TaxID=1423801 RepID=A0A0R1UUZ7_9LACO|nr:hypothetical protein FD50_GL002148 [Liquorilactobacillus satsumensis DSM 16230 = JCM 12392]